MFRRRNLSLFLILFFYSYFVNGIDFNLNLDDEEVDLEE